MTLNLINFVKKPWRLGREENAQKHLPIGILQIANSLPLQRRVFYEFDSDEMGPPFLQRNHRQCVKNLESCRQQMAAFRDGRLAALYPAVEMEEEEPEVENTIADDSDEDDDMRAIKEMQQQFEEHDLANTSRFYRDAPEGEVYKPDESDGSESDESSGDESESEAGPVDIDLSRNVLQEFFRCLNAKSPLLCYYTLWYAEAFLQRCPRDCEKMIQKLEQISESTKVQRSLEKPPREGISGRIENVENLSNVARRVLHRWHVVMRDRDAESDAESGLEEGPADAWNDYFPKTARNTPTATPSSATRSTLLRSSSRNSEKKKRSATPEQPKDVEATPIANSRTRRGSSVVQTPNFTPIQKSTPANPTPATLNKMTSTPRQAAKATPITQPSSNRKSPRHEILTTEKVPTKAVVDLKSPGSARRVLAPRNTLTETPIGRKRHSSSGLEMDIKRKSC
ncbi:unnamed protein product, partial [Mesorhabditis spiculigera]